MSVTFTRTTMVHDPDTNLLTPTELEITGQAMRVSGDPKVYADLKLKESEAPTLLFVPDDYEVDEPSDNTPAPGDVVDWNGIKYTARDVKPLAPDGWTILARVVVSR